MLINLLKPEIKTWFEKSAASEFYAHNLYHYLSNQMQRLGLFGAQKFYLKEAESEAEHFHILSDYVNDMGGVLGVPSVEKIEESVLNLKDALFISYETELELLNQYKSFYEYAEKEKDYSTTIFLNQMIKIQVKSVGEYGDLISKLNLSGDIYTFDKEMGKI